MNKKIYSVATFNIRYDEINDKENAWINRKDCVLNAIKFHNWDVFGLQEVLFHQLDYLKNLQEYKYVGVGRDDGEAKGEFIPIFYKKDKFIEEDNSTFWLSETPNIPSKSWNSNCTRICTWIRLRDIENNNTLLVMNIHLDDASEKARLESSKLILEKSQEISNNDDIIILGDFNSDFNEQCYKLMVSKFKDASKITENPYYGPIGTFNNFNFSTSWDELASIDHIFLSESIKVKSMATLTDNINNKYLSDHFPVVANIYL